MAVEELVRRTHAVEQFADHAVPLAGDAVDGAVVAVVDDLEDVVEAEHLRDLVDDVDDEALEAVVARQQLFGLFVHKVRLALESKG